MNERQDPEVDALLDALRRSESPSEVQLSAGLERLNLAIGSPATWAAGVATSTKVAASVGILGAAVALGWFALDRIGSEDENMPRGANGIVAASAPESGPEPANKNRPEPPALNVPSPTTAPADAANDGVQAPREPAPHMEPAPKKKQKKSAVEPARSGDLEAELALLQAAAAALAKGNPDRALKRVNQHRRRFPKSALRDERELLRGRALCDLGDVEEAQKVATMILKRDPNTHLARRLRTLCN